MTGGAPQQTIERPLPHSAESERAILGALILDKSLVGQADALLTAEDFYSPPHRQVFNAIISLCARGSEIDPILIGEELRQKGFLEQVGGVHDISELTYGLPPASPKTFRRYAEILRDHSQRRRIARLGVQVSQSALNGDETEAILSSLSAQVQREQQAKQNGHESASLSLAVKWSELERREFAPLDFIIHETARGEVAQITSATDIGKTTLLLNLTLSLCCGREMPPLVAGKSVPRRVLFCDFETRLSRLKHDIRRMTEQLTERERELVRENLNVLCDGFVDNEPLTLSNPSHLRLVELEATEHRADLIIVDTLAGAFNLENENDNAEAGRVVQKPFRQLAARTDALVLYSSHIGKASETGAAREARAYRMRGASAHGCFARSVFNLEPDAHDKDRVTLACAKAKGGKFKDAVLRLNTETRWFELTDEQPARIRTNYELVIETLRSAGGALRREEIDDALDGRAAKASITRELKSALVRGDARKCGRGLYEIANAQMLTPIRDEHLSISGNGTGATEVNSFAEYDF